MARVFVSYSRQDQLFVRRLVTDLEHFGADIWLDLDDIPIGAKWSTEIQKGLDSSTIMLVIISPYSMSSTNVEEEWQYFLDQKKSVVPILYEKARVHFQLNRLQYIDFVTQEYKVAFQQLHAQLLKEGIPLRQIPDDYTSDTPLRHREPSPAFQAAEERSAKKRTMPLSAVSDAPRPPNRGVLIGAGLIVVLLAILGVAVILPNLSLGTPTEVVQVPTATSTTTSTATLTELPSATSTNTASPTAPATLTATMIPSDTATATATAAPTLTPTIALTATATAAPTLAPGVAHYDAKTVAQVWVPASCFKMGSEDNDPLADNDEKPAHQVCITQGYWIDTYEVTNADYGKFIDDGGYTKREYWTDDGWDWVQKYHVSGPRDYANATGLRQPRAGISFYEAEAYAHWRGGRLPTEAEWEYAARGPQSLIYPWGNEYIAEIANVGLNANSNDQSSAVIVGGFPKNKSWVGAYDMCGNVAEYVSDWYDGTYYRMAVKDDPQGPPTTKAKVLRGGAYNSTYKGCRTASRIDYPDFILGTVRIGMRIVSSK